MEPPRSGSRAIDRPKPATLSMFEWALNAEELLVDEAWQWDRFEQDPMGAWPARGAETNDETSDMTVPMGFGIDLN